MKKFVNSLTMTRVIATLLLPILWKLLNPIALLTVVVLILLTDFFDGFLARKFKVQTLFGSIADQVADKMFGIMMLLIIGIYKPLFYLVAIMEIAIAVINVLGGVRGARTNSSFLGKTKMWVLGAASTFAIIAIFDKQLYQAIDINWVKDAIEFFWKYEENFVASLALITIGAQVMVSVDYAKGIKQEITGNKKIIKYNFKEKKELMKVLFDTKYYLNNKDLPYSKHFLK